MPYLSLMPARLRNGLFLIIYGAAYFASLLILVHTRQFSASEPIALLVIVGGLFSLVAWFLTRHFESLAVDTGPVAPALLYLIVAATFVTWGLGAMPRWQPLHDIAATASKLVVFVIVPSLLLRTRLTFRWNNRDTAIALGMSAILVVFQAIFGRGLRTLASARMTAPTLVLSTIAAFLWLAIEAGLVEEYFFRAVLQTRLERATGSAVGGIIVTSLAFGLMHAPGLYLRTVATGETLRSPSLLTAVAYSVVFISVTGFFLGVIWSRTRNLLLLITIHAAGDLLPNLADFARNFHLWP